VSVIECPQRCRALSGERVTVCLAGGGGGLQSAAVPRHGRGRLGQVHGAGAITHIPGELALARHHERGHFLVPGRMYPFQSAVQPELSALEITRFLMEPASEFRILRPHVK
jgi:hypothetical protein